MDNSWPVEQQKNVMLGGGENALMLPEQASNIRLQSSETPQEIFRNISAFSPPPSMTFFCCSTGQLLSTKDSFVLMLSC
ncbi:hypothetical protein ACUOFC_36790 [Escherichia sp. TWPC-MK]